MKEIIGIIVAIFAVVLTVIVIISVTYDEGRRAGKRDMATQLDDRFAEGFAKGREFIHEEAVDRGYGHWQKFPFEMFGENQLFYWKGEPAPVTIIGPNGMKGKATGPIKVYDSTGAYGSETSLDDVIANQPGIGKEITAAMQDIEEVADLTAAALLDVALPEQTKQECKK